MSGATAVLFGALLLAAFLGVLAVMFWKNAGARRLQPGPIYVLDDAVGFVTGELGEEIELRRSDVRCILEWEVFYLQMRARKAHRQGGGDIVAGGTDQAVGYIQAKAEAKQQVTYSDAQIRAVLQGEAEYLKSIGAVGEVVT
ncbi:MAG: hypothetical protein ACN4GK_02310 [Acidimicrobiia bacterium]